MCFPFLEESYSTESEVLVVVLDYILLEVAPNPQT